MGSDQAPQFTRKNHYVPESYFKPWLGDDGKLSAYRTLVPAETYPAWERRAGSGVAYRFDLYTLAVEGHESDSVEQWFGREIETPALPIIAKLRRGEPLAPEDRVRLAAFLVALDLRTPIGYAEHRERLEAILPGVFESVFKSMKRDLEAYKSEGRLPSIRIDESEKLSPFHVSLEPVPGTDSVTVELGATIGRQMWLRGLPQTVASTAKLLSNYRWIRLRPYPGNRWITTDHPVVRLRYQHRRAYDFRGAWGLPGTEVFFPVSPSLMLYAKVGSDLEERTVDLDLPATLAIQRVVAQRAHRWIVASDDDWLAVSSRRRQVNRQAYTEEERAWKGWHADQSAAEREPGKPPTGVGEPQAENELIGGADRKA